jgi:hypothetical protein
MKCWQQIYVIYNLIPSKMKQIVFFLLSFYGISTACGQDTSVTALKYSVKFYPNPTKNKLQLEVNGFEAGYLQLKFIDNHGATVRQEKRLLVNGNEWITLMFFLEPGYYWLLVKQKGKIVRKGLLIK